MKLNKSEMQIIKALLHNEPLPYGYRKFRALQKLTDNRIVIKDGEKCLVNPVFKSELYKLVQQNIQHL